MQVRIECGDWQMLGAFCETVRRAVFVKEQSIPEDLEFDNDDAGALHFAAFDSNGKVVGCARMLADGRIGRVAVLKDKRGLGIGVGVMKGVLAKAQAQGRRSVYLGAQVRAMPFYEKLGFVPEGDPFDEAGIPHRLMRRNF